jgi:hypothetical protein
MRCQGVGFVLGVASVIVLLATFVSERNHVIHWSSLGICVAAAVSMVTLSGLALHLANKFKLAAVRATGCLACTQC